jgi:hypothetical protein
MLRGVPVGYLEYAWSLAFQKDQLNTKILVNSNVKQPLLIQDEVGHVIVLPLPSLSSAEDGTIQFLGYRALQDSTGKMKIAKLFKACVYHLSAHAEITNLKLYKKWEKERNYRLAKFTETLVEDARVNAYISAQHPETLLDIAFANTLAIERVKALEKIWNPATRVMSGVLCKEALGELKANVSREERESIDKAVEKLDNLKHRMLDFFTKKREKSDEPLLEIVDEIYQIFEPYGPVLEAPSLPNTESLGICTVFPPYSLQPDEPVKETFGKCLTVLSRNSSKQELSWSKAVEAESLQVFDAWSREREKKAKIAGYYEDIISLTRLKSIKFPEKNYSEYLRSRARVRGAVHRLLTSLLPVTDAMDEDTQKQYGILDVQRAIQVIAGRSSKTDVFMREELLGKSFAWVILVDASRSMRALGNETRDICVCLTDCLGKLMRDPGSWAIYAFNNDFLVLKDAKETYSRTVKARLGGLKFEGPTYMPDALKLVGEILKRRTESLRLLVVVSDGWPYGYLNITDALTETLTYLRKAQITVIGIGVHSDRMKNFFRLNCNIKEMQDIDKKVPSLYGMVSRAVVG